VEREVKMKIVVSENDLDKYLKEHPNAEKESEGYNLSHIFLRQTGDRNQLEEKAMGIYRKLKEGASFQESAALYSGDLSARGGGALGFIKKTDLNNDFLRVLSNVKEGQISEPFWSENGMHILKVNESVIFKNRREMLDAVRQKLHERMLRAEYGNWMKGLREKAYIEIKL
jgi:parvulin-like peptidyl-prolyl isomerase